MSASDGHGVDGFASQFVGKLPQLGDRKSARVCRSLDGVQQRRRLGHQET
jgi:hypothetical protein